MKPMKFSTLLIIGADMLSLFAGCSKPQAASAWSSSDSIIIEPGVSIGPLRSGMTMPQVIAEFGEPDQKEEVFVYSNLGLSVLPAKGGLVGSVLCGSSRKGGPVTKSFAGRTKEGIGIGSGRAEVITAYGEPTTTKSLGGGPGSELLRYKPLGIDFQIGDGKVTLIAVFFKTTT
jgi:hypothetical protein